MPTLPDPPGPYHVGATTFTLPVSPRAIGFSKIRTSSGTLEPALLLEEVAFTAFYPTSLKQSPLPTTFRKGLHWLTRPLRDAVQGYAHFAGISAMLVWPLVLFFGSHLKIPVYLNAPPLSHDPASQASINDASSSVPKSTSSPWPLVLFSHGLGGGRTTYSQLCAHLASSGRVVLALEHRDGTGPVFRTRSVDAGTSHRGLYLRPEDIIWDEGAPPEDANLALRAEQLEFRRWEVYLAYHAFRSLTGEEERQSLLRVDGASIIKEIWKGVARCDKDVALVGHSFGGATVFSTLSNPPPSTDTRPIPISHALALDPWLEPLPSPGPSPVALAGDRHPKMFVINAEGFTLWKDHFTRLQDLVRAWDGGRLITFVGATHLSFSDFLVMMPRPLRDASAESNLRSINNIAQSFLDDKLEETLDGLTTRKMEIHWVDPSRWSRNKRRKRRLVGNVGDVVLH